MPNVSNYKISTKENTGVVLRFQVRWFSWAMKCYKMRIFFAPKSFLKFIDISFSFLRDPIFFEFKLTETLTQTRIQVSNFFNKNHLISAVGLLRKSQQRVRQLKHFLERFIARCRKGSWIFKQWRLFVITFFEWYAKQFKNLKIKYKKFMFVNWAQKGLKISQKKVLLSNVGISLTVLYCNKLIEIEKSFGIRYYTNYETFILLTKIKLTISFRQITITERFRRFRFTK